MTQALALELSELWVLWASSALVLVLLVAWAARLQVLIQTLEEVLWPSLAFGILYSGGPVLKIRIFMTLFQVFIGGHL